MLKKLRIPALALAAAMAVAVPNLTLAAGRDDHRGRDFDRKEFVRNHHEREFGDRFHDAWRRDNHR
jgi:hypothetical protein